MPKKMLVKLEEGMTATSVALECASLLDAGLAEQLGPPSADEEGLAEGGRLAVRAARRLLMLKHNFEAASEALSRIEDELHRWRQKREAAHEALYDKAKGIRDLFRDIFDGDEGDTFLGLRGSLPREPKPLHAVFAPVVGRVGDFAWPMPESDCKWIEVDREKLVDEFLEAHDEVGTALLAIKGGESQEAVAKVAKKRAKTAYNLFLAKYCRFLEASLELGGLDELAAEVRPDVGRPGRPPKEKQLVPAALPGDGKALQAGGAARELPSARMAELPAADEGEDGD